MTDLTDNRAADQQLKAKHRAMWALGDYPAVAGEVIPALGPVLVRAAGIRPGDRVLDVAAGSGNVAIPAAEAGARVVASDLTPELLDVGRRQAEAQGLQLDWRTADAEELPFADGEFDVVTSCVGVMFAPNHQRAADELLRVCRPGGTLALISWTPEGFIGQMFATIKPYAPPPPPGTQPPPLWGNEEHVLDLLSDRVADLHTRRQSLRVDNFRDGVGFREYFKNHYGPTIVTYRALAEQPDRTAALDHKLAYLAAQHDLGGGAMDWEYLLVTARKR